MLHQIKRHPLETAVIAGLVGPLVRLALGAAFLIAACG